MDAALEARGRKVSWLGRSEGCILAVDHDLYAMEEYCSQILFGCRELNVEQQELKCGDRSR